MDSYRIRWDGRGPQGTRNPIWEKFWEKPLGCSAKK
jgi:hypothetical protein